MLTGYIAATGFTLTKLYLELPDGVTMKNVFVSAAIAIPLLTIVLGFAFIALPIAEASGLFGITTTTITSEKILPTAYDTIIDLDSTVIYTGTLDGTSDLQGTLVVHPNGSTDFHGVETFTGTVNGLPGTVTFKLTGGNRKAGAAQVTAVIVSATGDLANIHGVLWKDLGAFTYSGKILFDHSEGTRDLYKSTATK